MPGCFAGVQDEQYPCMMLIKTQISHYTSFQIFKQIMFLSGCSYKSVIYMVETGVNRGSEFSFKAGWRYVSTSVFPIMHFSSSSPFFSPLNLICGNPSLPQPMKNILAEVTVAPKGLRDRS